MVRSWLLSKQEEKYENRQIREVNSISLPEDNRFL